MTERWARKRHIIFDWNGTIVDDIDLAVRCVNECCRIYDVPPVNKEIYRERFQFPMRSFYAALGFNLERLDFANIVQTYLRVFDAEFADCPLHDGVEALLAELKDRGLMLSILSACHHPTLVRSVEHRGLLGYFTHVVGVDDQHATSKHERAASLQKLSGVDPSETLYIGDTGHDAEVAQAIGWAACLLSCGHQHANRLMGYRFDVLSGPLGLVSRAGASQTIQTEVVDD